MARSTRAPTRVLRRICAGIMTQFESQTKKHRWDRDEIWRPF